MRNLLYGLKLLFLVLFASFVIYTYYGTYGATHNDSFSGYSLYLWILLFLYVCYKWYHYVTQKEILSFCPITIVGLFFVHLLLLSWVFFQNNWEGFSNAIVLFFQIFMYLLLPTLMVFLMFTFWKKILSYIISFQSETIYFQNIMSIWFGFFVFLTILTLFSFVNQYNPWIVFLVLGLMWAFSWREIISTFLSLWNPSLQFENHKYSWESVLQLFQPRLLSTEFFFIIITFLISVNLISIMRPMPIGWDDMGVYMNYPQLLANAGWILPLGGMFSWQIFTGIWYMFHSATQAFYLNNVGSILSVLVLVWSMSDFLQSKKKTFLNIPLMLAMMFLSMPMVIFQQAKDMKLDSWLFFISVIVIYGFVYLFRKRFSQTGWNDEMTESSLKQWFSSGEWWYIAILWLLAWLAFSIKFTTLLLITGILGTIFYYFVWVFGFLGYGAIFVGVFTKFWLWSMMNVVYPQDDLAFRSKVFIASLVIGVGFWIWAITKNSKDHLIGAFKWILVFLLGTWLALAPWIAYNVSTSSTLSIGAMIWGQAAYFPVDYTKIHTQAELNDIRKTIEQQSISSSWTTQNEDMGRYFGYETGINNYIKLPFNLTFQTNQTGEYTDITYWFLALIPVIILFFSYKNVSLLSGMTAVSVFSFLFFFWKLLNTYFTSLFTKIDLPLGYVVILIFFLLPLLYWLYAMKNDDKSRMLKIVGVFWVWYIFFWAISAFGIVWYGIAMYFVLLFFIWFWAYYISQYEDATSETEMERNLLHLMGALIFFCLVNVYTFRSTIPHGLTNIVSSSYTNFKEAQSPKYATIFNSQPYYFDILKSLNIDSKKEKELLDSQLNSISSSQLKEILKQTNVQNLTQYQSILKELLEYSASNAQITPLRGTINDLLESLYASILYPKKEYKNTAWIYRIGTFLKYFISDNNVRIMEDSLVTEYDRYFYDAKNPSIWVERMKKMWVDYFLVDLNAATIDRDPRRDLTRRYENLLKTFTSDRLDLISTDSMCLRIALDNYKVSDKWENALNQYMTLAWVNYESYNESGALTQSRWEKQIVCYNYILKLIQEKKIDEKHYSYLLPIQQYLEKNKIGSEQDMLQFFQTYVTHGWVALYKILGN